MNNKNTKLISNNFFRQFDKEGEFDGCDLFTKMKVDFSNLLNTHIPTSNTDENNVIVNNFFDNYKELDTFVSCHLKDDMSAEMNKMFNDFERYCEKLGKEEKVMKIIFDGKEFNVNDSTHNIVQIAEENGVYIPAPCYRNEKSKGCCNGCVIEVDGKEGFACNTKPQDGMKITYDREDLNAKRKEKLMRYSEAIKTGNIGQNTCSTGGCGTVISAPSAKNGCGCSCNC